MPTLRIFVPGVPVAQPRPRFRVVPVGRGSRVQAYTPASHPVNAWRRAISESAILEVSKSNGDWPRGGPIVVRALFIFPQSGRKRLRRAGKVSRPDADNLLKAALDALACLWLDDSQVISSGVKKYVGCFGEPPGLWLHVKG